MIIGLGIYAFIMLLITLFCTFIPFEVAQKENIALTKHDFKMWRRYIWAIHVGFLLVAVEAFR